MAKLMLSSSPWKNAPTSCTSDAQLFYCFLPGNTVKQLRFYSTPRLFEKALMQRRPFLLSASSATASPSSNDRFLSVSTPMNPISSTISSRRWNSSNSFIRSVMEQVQKDLENQPKLKKAMEDLRTAAEENRTKKTKVSETMKQQWQKMSAFADEAMKMGKQINEWRLQGGKQISQRFPFLSVFGKLVNTVAVKTLQIMKGAFDKMKTIVDKFQEEKEGEKRTAAWRRSQAIKRYQAQQPTPTSTTEESAGNQKTTEEQPSDETFSTETSLILTKESAWDRFGTRLKDMPFLYNFFENPLIGKLFGETEIAASIRAMKELDSSFRFPEFMETIEQVVAPHLLECFLHGDSGSLRAHCGEAAFSAIDTSIREREVMKVQLDPTILRLSAVELRGAKRDEDNAPWFIFTFSAQQINCLRDSKGAVVTGAIDDIREVVYTIAITRHPEPELEGLHYPWMVKEFAIIGNSPSW